MWGKNITNDLQIHSFSSLAFSESGWFPYYDISCFPISSLLRMTNRACSYPSFKTSCQCAIGVKAGCFHHRIAHSLAAGTRPSSL